MARLKPIHTSVPSESTIEQMANHWLMNLRNPCYSWIYVPTRSEENYLGYDASLQGYKALAIQYKRLKPTRNIGSILINFKQHNSLVTNFPKLYKPCAFYAFSKYQNYSGIRDAYSRGRGMAFCREMVFFDIHSISPSSKSVTISYDYLIRNKITIYNLFQIAKMFSKCDIGVFLNEIDKTNNRDNSEAYTRANIMVSKV